MPLPSQYQSVIHLSRYARWNGRARRRETWEETVNRYVDFMVGHVRSRCGYDLLSDGTAAKMFSSIRQLRNMPSMRCMMMAGKALARDEAGGYNCWYTAIDHPHCLDEVMYLLLCGGGVGFSVERQYVGKLPMVPMRLTPSSFEVIVVEDSRLGWVRAFRRFVDGLYKGTVYNWDISKVRPSGAPLKTTGGRASGPGPLVDLFRFTLSTFERAKGRRLSSLEVHDIVCKIGDIVVMGGVRRSALISLSNLSDIRMRGAKAGNWMNTDPHRMLANNSWCAMERPEVGQFMTEWTSLYESKSGERGIFNRYAAVSKADSNGRRRAYYDDERQEPIDFGCNPCSEIILRSGQSCNLTEVVARHEDTIEELEDKVRMAAIMGTLQSTLTKFRHLRKHWRQNCEEERLLGVSITGILDCPLLNGLESSDVGTGKTFRHLKEVAIDTNREWAEKLDIPQSAAVTCVKPSGTVSQLVDSSSGIHARYARHYLRRIIMDNKDPMTEFMVNAGFPFEDSVYKPGHQTVFAFPMTAPEGAVLENEWNSMRQLDFWKLVQDNWCEHKPSATITVKEEEWPEVGAWVWKNFDSVSGLSFLPELGKSVYRQAPYEKAAPEQVEALRAQMPLADWSGLAEFEQVDNTKASQELACVAGNCEAV